MRLRLYSVLALALIASSTNAFGLQQPPPQSLTGRVVRVRTPSINGSIWVVTVRPGAPGTGIVFSGSDPVKCTAFMTAFNDKVEVTFHVDPNTGKKVVDDVDRRVD